MFFDAVSRRLFVVLVFQNPSQARSAARNELWREFVPLVKRTSHRLTSLQDFMVAHQSEARLIVLDTDALINLNSCISDLHAMQQKLQQLKAILVNKG